MNESKFNRIDTVIAELYEDSKYDMLKATKVMAKSIFKPLTPADFKDTYLSITKEQGADLVDLILKNNIKSVVEFGTSFGISTLYLSKGVTQTAGKIVTCELIESKAEIASENFSKAGVKELIEIRVGDAKNTLEKYNQKIDLLVLDGWKNLYSVILKMLENNLHKDSIVYVDNANMVEVKEFLFDLKDENKFSFEFQYNDKVALLRPI